RHTRCLSDWSSDVCSSDLTVAAKNIYLVPCLKTFQKCHMRPHSIPESHDMLFQRSLLVHVRREEPTILLPSIRSLWRSQFALTRSEERRVGKECRSLC